MSGKVDLFPTERETLIPFLSTEEGGAMVHAPLKENCSGKKKGMFLFFPWKGGNIEVRRLVKCQDGPSFRRTMRNKRHRTSLRCGEGRGHSAAGPAIRSPGKRGSAAPGSLKTWELFHLSVVENKKKKETRRKMKRRRLGVRISLHVKEVRRCRSGGKIRPKPTRKGGGGGEKPLLVFTSG